MAKSKRTSKYLVGWLPALLAVLLLITIGSIVPVSGTPNGPPHLEVDKNVAPESLQIDEQATVTLTIRGAGEPAQERLPLDVMLIIDRSGSMDDGDPTRLDAAKAAAIAFIDILIDNPADDRVGLVSFSGDGGGWGSVTLDIGLTVDFPALKGEINELVAGGATDPGDAIYIANQEFDTNGRPDAVWVEILLTDGGPNRPYGDGQGFDDDSALYALGAAQATSDAGITLYTIGLELYQGAKSEEFLDDQPASQHTVWPYDGLAYIGGGQYYYAPSSSDLQAIFEELAYALTTIAGTGVTVIEVLPGCVNYADGSASPPPDSVEGQTLTWSLGTMSIGDEEIITFDVTFQCCGEQLVDVYPDTRVEYIDYQQQGQAVPFPETWVNVTGEAYRVELLPETGSNTVGTEHDLTATVYDQHDNVVPDQALSWEITDGPGSFVSTEETTDVIGEANATITSTLVGTTTIKVSVSAEIYDTATKDWIRSGGGGGGGGILRCPETFVVDFLGEITKEPMQSTGQLCVALAAPSPDGMHLLEMKKGTKTVDSEDEIVKLIEITGVTAPALPAYTVLVGSAYEFSPPGITFDQLISLTLGYPVVELPGDTLSVAMAYYSEGSGWTMLEAESIQVADIGILTSLIDHLSIFAIIAEVPPPEFTVANLVVSPEEISPGEDVTISVLATNTGGSTGSTPVVLRVEGEVEDTAEATLAPGASDTITFSTTRDEAGTYGVTVNGLSGSFTVTEAPFPWWAVGLGVGLGALLLAGGAAYLWIWRPRMATP